MLVKLHAFARSSKSGILLFFLTLDQEAPHPTLSPRREGILLPLRFPVISRLLLEERHSSSLSWGRGPVLHAIR